MSSPKSIHYLSLDEVIAIHQHLIERFGGAKGLRDMGLLESALYRPRTGYYLDLVAMASALFESLINNYPFIDGNKRVAFFATDIFLRINGWRFNVDGPQAYLFLMNLFATEHCDKEHLEPWVRSSIEKI